MSNKAKVQLKDFTISTPSPNTNQLMLIPHKNVVKYLEVHIDYLLRLKSHPDLQLAKAKAAFKANNRIFYNKHLSRKTKDLLPTVSQADHDVCCTDLVGYERCSNGKL